MQIRYYFNYMLQAATNSAGIDSDVTAGDIITQVNGYKVTNAWVFGQQRPVIGCYCQP